MPEDEAGQPLFECDQATVEMIDFEAEHPSWQLQPLVQPVQQNNAVVLPTGKVVIVGGSLGRGPWENSFRLQLFDPEEPVKPLVATKVPRHDHSTVTLLADGSVSRWAATRAIWPTTPSGPMRAFRTRRSTSRPTSSAASGRHREGAREARVRPSFQGQDLGRGRAGGGLGRAPPHRPVTTTGTGATAT